MKYFYPARPAGFALVVSTKHHPVAAPILHKHVYHFGGAWSCQIRNVTWWVEQRETEGKQEEKKQRMRKGEKPAATSVC